MNNTPPPDPQTPLGILRKAYDSVTKETDTPQGNSWVKGLYRHTARDRKGKEYTQQCMIGALSEACGREHGYFGQTEMEAAGFLAEAMYEVLTSSEDEEKQLAAQGAGRYGRNNPLNAIPSMNDADPTEWEDVDKAFLKAIKKAEEAQCGPSQLTEEQKTVLDNAPSLQPEDEPF